jgi:hypothetical protein
VDHFQRRPKLFDYLRCGHRQVDARIGKSAVDVAQLGLERLYRGRVVDRELYLRPGKYRRPNLSHSRLKVSRYDCCPLSWPMRFCARHRKALGKKLLDKLFPLALIRIVHAVVIGWKRQRLPQLLECHRPRSFSIATQIEHLGALSSAASATWSAQSASTS